MILTALYAALTWLAIITIAVIGISLYGARKLHGEFHRPDKDIAK